MFVRMTASYSLLKNICKNAWRSKIPFVYLRCKYDDIYRVKINKNQINKLCQKLNLTK